MNIIFVNYWNFTSPSAIHIQHLADKLAELGHRCLALVPHAKDSLGHTGPTALEALEFSTALESDSPLRHLKGPSVIIAWTPRENVRRMVQKLARELGLPYVVHLEDNEEAILERATATPWTRLVGMEEEPLDKLVGDSLSHPRRYKEFLAGSAGVTAIIEGLLRFVPEGVPGQVFWPGCEDELLDDPPAPDPELRAELRIHPEERVVVYPGSGHPACKEDIFSLYLAVALLNRKGHRVRLVRIGTDHCDVIPKRYAFLEKNVITLGGMPPPSVPRYLALADLLVQPGRPDEFNRYRFPSKLTVYMALGKPVIMPAVNLGEYLNDGEEALLLKEGTAVEIAARMAELLIDPRLAGKLARNARRFAVSHFSWSTAAIKVGHFLKQVAVAA